MVEILQPILVSQSVVASLPVNFAGVLVLLPEGEAILQPGELDVWRVMWFTCPSFIPSRISISPPAGQLGPSSQNAGHTPHVEPGMCKMSATKRPLV